MLSPRLQLLYDGILPKRPLWDIGCDHGYVGLAAYANRRCPEVHLVDRSERVVADLQKCLAERFPKGHDGLHLWHCDATKRPLPVTGGTVLMAGMGTETILAVLAKLCPDRPPPDLRLVLASNVNEERLRLALARSDWRLHQETLYRDKRHVRQVIACAADGLPIHPFWNAAAGSHDHGLLEPFLKTRRRYLDSRRSQEPDLLHLRAALDTCPGA